MKIVQNEISYWLGVLNIALWARKRSIMWATVGWLTLVIGVALANMILITAMGHGEWTAFMNVFLLLFIMASTVGLSYFYFEGKKISNPIVGAKDLSWFMPPKDETGNVLLGMMAFGVAVIFSDFYRPMVAYPEEQAWTLGYSDLFWFELANTLTMYISIAMLITHWFLAAIVHYYNSRVPNSFRAGYGGLVQNLSDAYMERYPHPDEVLDQKALLTRTREIDEAIRNSENVRDLFPDLFPSGDESE